MRFSYSWLAEHVEAPDAAEVAQRLTSSGNAVELVEQVDGDLVLDVDVTTNRPDCMCHVGLARELAVLSGRLLRLPRSEPDEVAERAADRVRVSIDAPAECDRYVARVVRGVSVGPSPAWLRGRLEAIGSRSINNVVDVTNYVLWELGQPLHAFDLATLAGSEIRVRAARPGERLTTLDGESRVLEPEMLVIADAERAVALAGVMGGLDTEVSATTRDVLIESAWFDPSSVRRTAQRLGMHTDASHRFERGVDPEGSRRAADRAALLIAEVAGGEVLTGAVDVRAEPSALPAATPIHLDPARVSAFAGLEVPAARSREILSGLGFSVDESADGFAVVVPSWRRFDVTEAADLYEEVLRVIGFDAIPATLPAIAGPDGPELVGHRRRRTVRRVLAAAGYAEAICYAFHDRESDERIPGLRTGGEPLQLANPLSERLAILRRSLVPGLVAAAEFNRNRGSAAVRLFEIGHAFWSEDGERREADQLGIVLGGGLGTPWERRIELDLFDLKGAVENVAETLQTTLVAEPADLPWGVPGRCARLRSESGAVVGWLAELASDDETQLLAAELDLDAMPDGETFRQVVPPSRLPGIAVDLTLTHPLEVSWQQLARRIEESAPPDLATFGLKDRYQGEGVAEGCVNTTIFFRYQAAERSLTQDEVNARHARLAATLQESFGR